MGQESGAMTGLITAVSEMAASTDRSGPQTGINNPMQPSVVSAAAGCLLPAHK